jgi:hypothetical protein
MKYRGVTFAIRLVRISRHEKMYFYAVTGPAWLAQSPLYKSPPYATKAEATRHAHVDIEQALASQGLVSASRSHVAAKKSIDKFNTQAKTRSRIAPIDTLTPGELRALVKILFANAPLRPSELGSRNYMALWKKGYLVQLPTQNAFALNQERRSDIGRAIGLRS